MILIIALLTAALPAHAVSGFTFIPEHQVGTGGSFSLVSLHGWMTNTGDQRDTFQVHKDETLPSDWQSSFCLGETCYPPFLNDVEIALDPAEAVEIFVDIQVNTAVGSGFDLVSITSVNDPTVTDSWIFAAIHLDCDVLVVDDSQDGTGLRGFFETNLAPRIPGIWPRAAELPTLGDLAAFPKVFWMTGDLDPSLDADDRALLGSFLDGGGALMLSGQDLAGDLCDPSSPDYSDEAKSWFEGNLGLAWAGDGTAVSVLGEPGNLIGDGLAFDLDAGQPDPDLLTLLEGPASVSFRYGSPDDGAVAGAMRTDHGRLVYFGFGLEGLVDTRGAVATLLDRVYLALNDPTGLQPSEPSGLRLLGNFPNPFNPKTSIRFTAAASGRGELRIFDAAGRRLRSRAVAVSEGSNQLDFEGASLSSGIYLYQLRFDGKTVSGRMVLAK